MYFFATLSYLPIASWKASHSTHLSICYQTFLEGSPWSPKLLQICRHIVTSYSGEVSFMRYCCQDLHAAYGSHEFNVSKNTA